MEIEPVYDKGEAVWFAGTLMHAPPPTPTCRRGDYFLWPSPDGTTKYGHGEEYITNKKAVEACERLRALPPEELRKLAPWYWES